MFDFPKQERVSGLIQEAVMRIPNLNTSYNIDLNREFSKVWSLLEAAPASHGQKTFLLGLAHQHIRRAEGLTVKQITGDSSISVDEMSHLVRVRLICAELSSLLAQSLEEFKARIRKPARRVSAY